MITQIMINFPEILIWPVRPYDMFSAKFGVLKTDLWAKEVGKFLCDMKNWLVGIPLPTYLVATI